MKIVQIVHGYPPGLSGGTEQYVRDITEGLRDRGHRLFVYAGSMEWREKFTVEATELDGYEVTRIHRDDLYFDRWDKAYNPLVEEHFRGFLADRAPDVIHIHQWIRLTSNLCAIAAEAGVPAVVTLHEFYTTCPRLFRMKADGQLCVARMSTKNCLHCAERWLFQRDDEIRRALDSYKADLEQELRCAARLLAPSWSHASAVAERLGLDGLDIQLLPMARRRNLNPAPRTAREGKRRIVFFSHLYPHKGPKVLVEAFCAMKHRELADLHLFGAEVLPDFAAELKAISEGQDVFFHGPYSRGDLESFPMDVVVIPSLVPETYSFILDEAVGLGVPVLAADTGALAERASDAVMLFRRGDAKDLAEKLDCMVEDDSVLNRMRSAEPPAVLSIDEHLNRLEAFYAQAVKGGPRLTSDDRALERLKDQWTRREDGFKELIRSEQWESLTDSLRKRIEELEKKLSD